MDVAPPSVAVIARSASWKEGRRRGGGRREKRGWRLHPSSPACFGGVRGEGGGVPAFPVACAGFREKKLRKAPDDCGFGAENFRAGLRYNEWKATSSCDPPPPFPGLEASGGAGKGGIRGRTKVAALGESNRHPSAHATLLCCIHPGQ